MNRYLEIIRLTQMSVVYIHIYIYGHGLTGDFNEILLQSEKYGAVNRTYGQMEDFRLALEECGLSDLGYRGYKYTWSNNKEGESFTKERLDRVFGNSKWLSSYGQYSTSTIATNCSYHKPILISLYASNIYINRERLFRYEAS